MRPKPVIVHLRHLKNNESTGIVRSVQDNSLARQETTMKRLLVVCLILCSVTVFPQDKKMPPFEIPTARTSGMGGSYAAYTDTVFALLVNPAAITRVGQKSIFGFSPALLNPKRASDIGSSLKNFDDLPGILDVFTGDTPVGFDLREFPFGFAWVSHGLGVGLWSRFFVDPNFAGSQQQLKLYGDVIMPVGFAVKFLETDTQSIDLGITVKPFARVIIQGELDPDILSADGLDPLDSSSIPLIAGTGFDLGLMYRWNIGLNVGFTANDIFTRGRTVHALRGDKDDYVYYVPFTMNLGAAYDFKIGNFWTAAPGFLANTGVAFAVNLDDIGAVLSAGYDLQHFFMDYFRAGVQLSMFDMLVVSGGLRGILPTVGIGVNLGPVQIDAAYYEKRFADEQFASIPMLELTIAIRPKVKEIEWSWTRKSILGAITKSEKL